MLVAMHFIYPLKRLISHPYIYIGLVPIVFGIIINVWADCLFKKEKTTVKPIEMPMVLITYGPFRLSRHPMYFGMAAILIGTSILLGSLTIFIFPLIFIILIQILFIPAEEKNLEEIFGGKYFDYKKKTRCWL